MCIHSVAVVPLMRRKGVAGALLREYVRRLSAPNPNPRGKDASSGVKVGIERFLLISHEELRGLYEGAGFEWIGKSAVQHGARDWFEMRLEVPVTPHVELEPELEVEAPPPPSGQEYSQEAILAALSAPRPVNSSSDSNGPRIWSEDDGDSWTTEVGDPFDARRNAKKLACLRCSSLVLLPRTCILTKGPSRPVSILSPHLISDPTSRTNNVSFPFKYSSNRPRIPCLHH